MNRIATTRRRSLLVLSTAVLFCTVFGRQRHANAATYTGNLDGFWYMPTTGNNGSGGDDVKLTYPAAGGVQNASGGTASITCPILKSTSNWGKPADQITAVKVTVSGGASTTVNCNVNVWDVSFASGAGLPTLFKTDPSTPFSGTHQSEQRHEKLDRDSREDGEQLLQPINDAH